MARSLNDRFAESSGEPIYVDGETVHIALQCPIATGDRVVVEFVSWSTERVQGLNLRIRDGLLEANEVRSRALSLWVDSAPAIVEVSCIKSPADGMLMISNQWRRPDGVEDEWANNAGMVVEESDRCVLLRCSDGMGLRPSTIWSLRSG